MHGKKLNFVFVTPRKWTDMPPITRNIREKSATVATFNVLLPESYQLFIFEDVWKVHSTLPTSDDNEEDDDINVMDIVRRMRHVGLMDNRILVNNILVDLFEQNQLAFDAIRHASDEDAVTYLAWIMWWSGNWEWKIRYNDFHALMTAFSNQDTSTAATKRINRYALACLMAAI